MPPSPVSLLDVVAMLEDRPDQQLARGQVGTVVDELDSQTVLVEFTDDGGRTWALEPVPVSSLLVLRYEPLAA
jgi:hypothetical protein